MTAGGISPAELHAALCAGGELALLDLREQGVFGRSHILLANNLPFSHLELRIRDLVPRLATPLVLCDEGEGLAARAASKLAAAGYSDVRILEGGVAAWGAAGYQLYSGINVPSKAFGEVIEHRCGTPNLTAEALKARIDAGEDLVILDSRPLDEYRVMSIPGGIDTPGAELVYRVRDLAPDPETLVVVNCAGRTRSIIGAQSLINAGLPNPVMALRNGTMGWHLAGYGLEHAAERRYGPVSDAALSWSRAAAEEVAARFGVRRIDAGQLEAWRSEAEEARTLYLLDVRDPEEYAAGHLPGALSAPGGQLVQSTDRWIAVRAARIVLVDDNCVRATMTASWLRQMGFEDVTVLEGGLEGAALESGPGGAPVPELALAPETVSPWELQSSPQDWLVLDLGNSLAHRRGHIPGAGWAIRSRLPEAEEDLAGPRRLVFTSEDGRLARLAAAELSTRWPAAVLEGGTAAWTAAGLPLAEGMERALHPEEDVYHRPYDRESGVEAAMQGYLDWEVALTEQLARDETLRFPEFPE